MLVLIRCWVPDESLDVECKSEEEAKRILKRLRAEFPGNRYEIVRDDGLRCVRCGTPLTMTALPDTGTSVDMYEAKCLKGHRYAVSIDNQTNQISVQEELT